MTSDIARGVRAAYDAAGRAGYAGPQRVYESLAAATVAAAGRSLAGELVLDAGTGGGALARAFAAVGARVVACDGSLGQLLPGAARRPPAVVGDLTRLPLRTDTFACAGAGFVLSHLPDPVAGLRELARVTRPGGLVLCSSFAATDSSPVKRVVESVAETFGYERPRWYEEMKAGFEPRVAHADALSTDATAAGLTDVDVVREPVHLRLTGTEVIDWRLGMANLAEFLAALPPTRVSELRDAAESAVGPGPHVVDLPLLVLRAIAP